MIARIRTILLTDYIGASTVAGRMSSAPMRTDAGTRAPAGASFGTGTGFSNCFRMVTILGQKSEGPRAGGPLEKP